MEVNTKKTEVSPSMKRLYSMPMVRQIKSTETVDKIPRVTEGTESGTSFGAS